MMTNHLAKVTASLRLQLLLLALLVAPFNLHSQLLPESANDAKEELPSEQSLIETFGETLPSDDEMAHRLQQIFNNLSALNNVSVTVEDGVVFLDGRVEDNAALEQAGHLAGRISGAVAVVNNIDRDLSVGKRLRVALNGTFEQFADLLDFAPLLLLASFVVSLAFLLAHLVGKSDWLIRYMPSNWILRDLATQLIQLLIVCIGLLIALDLLDATALLGSLVGALGILGLAIGFATRDTVENYIASILLSIRQPFRHEEYVKIDDLEGKVVRLTSRATVLMSLEGNHIRIPNAAVFKAKIVNYTRNPLRRFEFKVGVDTDLDLTEPRRLTLETLEQIPGVLKSPAPVCLVDALGDSSVILKVQAWINQQESDFQKTRSEAQRLVKEAFDDAGVVMPEPIYNVNLREAKSGTSRARTTAEKSPGPSEPTTSPTADTTPDNAVEKQIRADQEASGEERDLLSRNAPGE